MRQLIPLLVLAAAAGAAAAEPPERLDAFGDWAVFVSDAPRECFATSQALTETGWPQTGTDTGTGGLSQLLVTFRPAADRDPDRPGELSLWPAGRAIAAGTTLTLTAGSADLLLFTDGSWAWPPNSAGDAAALAALSAAATAQVTLRAGDMSPVALDFSLTGFAEAVDRARLYCATIGAGL